MKTDSSKKIIGLALGSLALVSFAAWMNPGGYFYPESENAFLRSLQKKTTVYTTTLPEDKVYLSFDKPFYEPGETIWFSAFVRDGQSLLSSRKSDILHVMLINPKGGVEKELKLVAHDGMTSADFALSKDAPGGLV